MLLMKIIARNAADRAKFMVLTAAEHGHVDDLRLLIAAKADVEEKNPHETVLATALEWTDRKGDAEFLLQAKADVNRCGPMLPAAKQGDPRLLGNLIAAKGDLECTNRNGETPLATAATNDRTEAVQQLIAAKASYDAFKNTEGLTPVALAAAMGYTNTLRALIDAKASVDDRTKFHDRPVSLAIVNDNIAALQLLVTAKADILSPCLLNHHRITPLLMSVDSQTTDALEILLKAKANIDATTYAKSRRTALCLAALYGKADFVKMLLDAKADVNKQHPVGNAVRRHFQKNDDATVLRLLITAKADVNKVGEFGETPAFMAATRYAKYRHDRALVSTLVDAKADMNITDSIGHTAAFLVAREDAKEREQRMREKGAKRKRKLQGKRLVKERKSHGTEKMSWA